MPISGIRGQVSGIKKNLTRTFPPQPDPSVLGKKTDGWPSIERLILCIDLPACGRSSATTRGSRAIQTNPFIHDVNQRYARILMRRNWFMAAGHIPGVHNGVVEPDGIEPTT